MSEKFHDEILMKKQSLWNLKNSPLKLTCYAVSLYVHTYIHAPQKQSLGVLHVFIFHHTTMHSVAGYVWLYCVSNTITSILGIGSISNLPSNVNQSGDYIHETTQVTYVLVTAAIIIEVCDRIIVVSDYCYYIFP